MAQDNKIQMPGVFGGLMRDDEEYKSRIMLSPTAVVVYIIVIVLFVLIMKVFFPFVPSGGSVDVGNPVHGGWVLFLFGLGKIKGKVVS